MLIVLLRLWGLLFCEFSSGTFIEAVGHGDFLPDLPMDLSLFCELSSEVAACTSRDVDFLSEFHLISSLFCELSSEFFTGAGGLLTVVPE